MCVCVFIEDGVLCSNECHYIQRLVEIGFIAFDSQRR